jgi:hypothetical protein
MTELFVVAGLVQLAIAAANLPVARKLRLAENLARVDPLVRQTYRAHHAYIVGLILLFAGLSILAPSELARGPWAAVLAVFWGARVVLQLGYYDRGFRRRHRAADVAFTAAFAGLAAVYAWGALR